MQLVLDFISGNERMPKFHDVLCFTIESARPLLSECMSCTHGRCSAKSKSLKHERGYTFCIHSTCATYQMLLCLVCLDMIFVLHAPLGFEQKSALDPSFLSRNSFANMLTIAKTVMHGTFCFAIENVAEPFGFKEKLCFKHVFSVRKPMMQRPFMYKTDGADAMHLSRTDGGRDFANPLVSETLSP